MNRSDRPTVNPAAVLREEFDDWALLFNPDTGDTVGTNPMGVAVWKLMDGRRNIASILAEVKERFSNVPNGAVYEILAFLDNLVRRGFISLEPTSGDE